MRIGAYKSASFIEFTPLPELSSISFDLVASIEGRQVRNNSLALTGAGDFLEQLDTLHSRWAGVATLTGTYDFTLQIRALHPSRLWISLYLVDYISVLPAENLPCMRHILDAGFVLEDAAAERLFDQFNELLGHVRQA
jgi:hypothetical protein